MPQPQVSLRYLVISAKTFAIGVLAQITVDVQGQLSAVGNGQQSSTAWHLLEGRSTFLYLAVLFVGGRCCPPVYNFMMAMFAAAIVSR